MVVAEIGEAGFIRTFHDTQPVSVIADTDPVYCIEVPPLKDITEETTTSAYVLLCWINVVCGDDGIKKFGKLLPYVSHLFKCLFLARTNILSYLTLIGCKKCY